MLLYVANQIASLEDNKQKHLNKIMNVEFAGTLTLYSIPRNLTFEQQGLFTIVLAMVNELCVENPNWQGEDVYLDLSGNLDNEVMVELNKILRNEGIALYAGQLEMGKWKIGLVKKIEFLERIELLKAS